MNRQRGVIAAWVYLAGAVAILGLLSGMGLMVKSYLDGVDKKAFDRGIAEERARWQGRESKELTDANLKIEALNTIYREREASFALEINGLSAKHEEDKRNAKDIHDRDVAAVRAGFRLRDAGTRPTAPCKDSGGGATAETVPAAGKPDAAGGSELSETASGFLLGEANRADALVVQLGKVQDLATKYWNACGAPNKVRP